MALTDNLVAYWKLDAASGNESDSVGSNTLTETGGTIASTTGKIGNARDFEAVDTEWFEIADNTDLSTGDIDFTIQMWINLESKAADSSAIAKWSSTDREYVLYYAGGATDRFYFGVSSNGTTGVFVAANNFGSPSLATWYQVHAWHDSVNNVIGISVNAGTANTAAHTTGVRDGAAAFTLGFQVIGTSGYLDGLLDEVGFWKRVLTSSERTELYNGGAGLAYPFSSSPATTGTASIRATGLLAVTAAKASTTAVAMRAGSRLAAATTKAATATAALAATARGSTAAVKASTATAGERGTGLLSAAGNASRAAVVAIRGAGLLRSAGGAAPPEFSEAAAARGRAWMQATGVRGSTGTLTLSGSGRLAGAAVRAATAQAVIRGHGRLVGAAASARLSVAGLRGQGRMQIAAGTLTLAAIRAAVSDSVYATATASDAVYSAATASDSEG